MSLQALMPPHIRHVFTEMTLRYAAPGRSHCPRP